MSGSIAVAEPGRAGHALDAPVAALAGLAVAFLAFAAPAGPLAEFVAATGLPSLLPAAQPPLGFNARLGLASAGAVAMFVLVFGLLRWLGRSRPVRTERPPAPEAAFEVAEPVRVRRRDFHPDAPPRPPILAAAELGEPAPTPWSEPEPLVLDDPQPEPEPAPPPAAAVDPQPATAIDPAPTAWLTEREASVSAEPEPEPTPQPCEAPKPAPVPPIGTSISELMERLEQGLARRRTGASIATSLPEPPTVPDPCDDRLQSAIESLQRLAARQG